MSAPIYDDQLNKILLKPRFKIEAGEGVDELISKFKVQLKENYPEYRSKVIGNNIVVDVPAATDTFWSPQLHLPMPGRHARLKPEAGTSSRAATAELGDGCLLQHAGATPLQTR